MRIRFIVLFCLLFALELKGQDFQPLFEPGEEYELILRDGSTVRGVVMEFRDGVVTLRNPSGDFRVNVKDIRRIKGGPEKKSESNTEWFASPKRGLYVLGPSGIPMEPNEINYTNVFILINTVNYGITNAVSVGAGFELLSGLLGHPIYYVNPRISIPIKSKLHVGTGILFISAPTLDYDNISYNVDVNKYYDLGVLYGSTSLGTSDRNVTLLAGYGFLNSKAIEYPTVGLSGIYRLGSRIALISENWLLPDFYIISYGMRLMTRRVAFDFTFINNHEFYEEGTFNIGIPFISFTLKLGKLKEGP